MTSPEKRLWSKVVKQALLDAYEEEKQYASGIDNLTRWARSKDAKIVFDYLDIEHSEKLVQGLVNIVKKRLQT